MSNTDTTTGTATSRARQVRKAVRRQTKARLALSGASGSGKTWTALSIARIIAPGKPVVVIDTEPADDTQGAATLYADEFDFDCIEWQPPFDPRDLALTIRDLGRLYPGGVLIIDSASHFWRGPGGTLDIADGRFGGWKSATPAQDDMVAAILRSSMHVICCTRAKQAYDVEQDAGGKQQVRKLGLAPIQRDDLEYEFQVVVMMDDSHRMDVGKTRAAPLAGQSYPANQQDEFARVYGEWLASGVTPAREEEIDAIPIALRQLPEAAQAKARSEMADQFGRARALTDDQMPGVWSYLAGALDLDAHRYVDGGDGFCQGCGVPAVARWHRDDADPLPARSSEPHTPAPVDDGDQLPGTGDPDPDPVAPPDPQPDGDPDYGPGEEPFDAPPDDGLPAEPEFHDDNDPAGVVDEPELPDGVEPREDLSNQDVLDCIDEILGEVRAMAPKAMAAALQERDLSPAGSVHQLVRRLTQALLADVGVIVTQDALKADRFTAS